MTLEIPLEDFGFDIDTFPSIKFPHLPGGKMAESLEELIQCLRRISVTNQKLTNVDLIEDIRKRKIINPILVFLNESDRKYRIVDGYRRYFVYEKLNEEYPGEDWDKIPATIVFSKEPTDMELHKFRMHLQLKQNKRDYGQQA